ncbi:MAG: DUF6798 domain-containing protein [Desulfobacterales bacterium]
MKTILRRIVNRVNRTDKRLLIFALLFLNTLSLVLGENEEEYLAFAKAFMDHAWIPGAKSVIDIPGTRIIFDTVTGFALRYATFEQVAIAGRCLIALLFAFPLARIFTKLRFTNLESIFLLQLICVLSHQSFFGKEWIFRSFETKTISYVFVFYSLYYLLDTRYLQGVLFAGFAVYFHILVGGWYALLLFVFLLVSGTPLKSLLRYALVFSALTAPFGLYLADTYLVDNPGIIDGVRISQIYVYLRNPHHLDIISQIGHWGSSTQIGVILSLLAGWLCVRLYVSNRDEVVRKLALFNIVIFGQQLISLLIALKDKSGGFLKFYPYRTSSLSLFLVSLLLMVLAKRSFLQPHPRTEGASPSEEAVDGYSTVVAVVMIVCIAAGLGVNLVKNARDSYRLLWPAPEASARMSLYGWIKNHTPPDAVFLNLNQRLRDDLDFTRRTDRDRFSVFKFVPTSNRMIYDWYRRVQEKDRVKGDIAVIDELAKKYRIDFVVSKTPLDDRHLKLVYSNDYYFLYAL